MKTIGYYSLIQYCPNLARMESVNIGLILFVPELRFVETQVNSNNDRVRKFFDTGTFNNSWLHAAKKSVEERIGIIKDELVTLEDFKKFIDTRINEIILTQPSAVKVGNPQEKLNLLFDKLVKYSREKKEKDPIIKEFADAFSSPHLASKIEKNISFPIPTLGQTIEAPYAYRNGCYNIIKPKLFSSKHFIRTGSLLVTEGRFIKKTGEAQLIIVPEIHTHDIRNSLNEIFKDAEVRAIWPEQRLDFIQEVEREAH